MPVAHDANAAYSVPRSDAKARPPPGGGHASPPAAYPRPGKFRVHPTGTEQNATLNGMDHQGAGRSRPVADPRGQPSWPWPEGGGSGVPESTGDSESTGPLPARWAGYGPAGSGAQRILGSETGPLRTPVRGFPPGREPT